jgi:hypothetical protein
MLRSLHDYIGHTVRHNGQTCRLIEILEDGPAMVFACPGQPPVLQANQHGEVGRHAPRTWTVPILSELGHDLHPVAKEVFPAEIHADLLETLLKARAQS